ncbi:MAG: hypothetical protein Q7V05_13055 [Methanoregula sp.]|nr:hypothetical protein [Methanoregula sp.]
MKKIRQKDLPPDQRDWLDRPKTKHIEGSTIAFFLGILILIGIIYLAVITPNIIDSLMKSILGENSIFLSENVSTGFQIDGVTYDTKDIVIDFFKNITSK